MTPKQQEKLIAKIAGELATVLPSFIRVGEYHTLSRDLLDGPVQYFLRFDFDLGTTAGKHYSIRIDVEKKNMTSCEVMGILFMELGKECYGRGVVHARQELAENVLRSAGLKEFIHSLR